MKQRLMSVVLAVALVCAMAVSASAVLVPSVTLPKPGMDKAEMSDGTEIAEGDLIVSARNDAELPAEKQQELEQAIAEMNQYETISEFLAHLNLTEAVQAVLPADVPVDDMVVYNAFDVSAYGTVKEALLNGASVTIQFQVAGLTANDGVVVLHYSDGAWDVRPSTAGDGYVEATFDSLSPVVILVEKDSNVGIGGGDSGSVSPETGESSMMPVLACGAVLSALILGYAVVRAKRI